MKALALLPGWGPAPWWFAYLVGVAVGFVLAFGGVAWASTPGAPFVPAAGDLTWPSVVAFAFYRITEKGIPIHVHNPRQAGWEKPT